MQSRQIRKMNRISSIKERKLTTLGIDEINFRNVPLHPELQELLKENQEFPFIATLYFNKQVLSKVSINCISEEGIQFIRESACTFPDSLPEAWKKVFALPVKPIQVYSNDDKNLRFAVKLETASLQDPQQASSIYYWEYIGKSAFPADCSYIECPFYEWSGAPNFFFIEKRTTGLAYQYHGGLGYAPL